MCREGAEMYAAISCDEARSSARAVPAGCMVGAKLPLTRNWFPANLMEMKVVRVRKGVNQCQDQSQPKKI